MAYVDQIDLLYWLTASTMLSKEPATATSLPSPNKSSAMQMTLISTESKQFAAQYDAGAIFMLGGALRAHEVLSECGFGAQKYNGGRHLLAPCTGGISSYDTTAGNDMTRDGTNPSREAPSPS